MKTYWLEKREKRSVMTKGITIQEPHQWHTRSFEKRISTVGAIGLISPGMYDKSTSRDVPSRRGSSKMSSPTPPGSSGFFSEERRIYSPITFHDVARRSVANSPTKNMEIRGRKLALFAIFNINGIPLFIAINIFFLAECRSNSMSAMGVKNVSDMFSSLLSDTEEHFRQHRDSLSPRAENRSASVHMKPEVKINTVSSSSSSSQSSEDESNPSLESSQTRKDNVDTTAGDNSECAAISSDLSNSQLLMQQDQCCPGFTMPKSSKMRHQGNSCIIF